MGGVGGGFDAALLGSLEGRSQKMAAMLAFSSGEPILVRMFESVHVCACVFLVRECVSACVRKIEK